MLFGQALSTAFRPGPGVDFGQAQTCISARPWGAFRPGPNVHPGQAQTCISARPQYYFFTKRSGSGPPKAHFGQALGCISARPKRASRPGSNVHFGQVQT